MKQGLGIIPAKQANRQLVMRLPGCGTILQAALFRSLPRMASQKWPIWLSILRPTFPARPAGPMTISLHPSVTAFQVLRVGLTTIFSPPSVILFLTWPAGATTIFGRSRADRCQNIIVGPARNARNEMSDGRKNVV